VKNPTRLIRLFLFTCILAGFFGSPQKSLAANFNQNDDPAAKAAKTAALLTPAEKVGQLFLVTFKDTTVDLTSQIYDLIAKRHIGGVVFKAANDNFTESENMTVDVQRLINDLQTTAWSSKQATSSTFEQTLAPSAGFIPLFIGISQEGDQTPYDQILSGVTQLPDEMAIGATWNTQNAQKVGNVLGIELHALGFNLLFGPSLDVLDVLHTEGGEDLGTRTFGGDPYWVGIMGQAFIQGVHEGSSNGIAVIAKHFPGRGGSDRPPEEEVATVRKSLEQLKQIELAPFFAVTGKATDPLEVTDGLLVSHIRYQGFQGNIRATTKPVSFDSAALETIMALPEFAQWRTNGGIVVSDDLGSQAVRKFFDPTGKTFDGRQVARSAFLAGNDLLYMDNFVATGDPDTYTTISRTLDFFTQKYTEDSAFAERVDASVLRLLTLKYKIYPSFTPDGVFPKTGNLTLLNQSQQVVFDVARQSATLISPDASELDTVLPKPPELYERIIIFSDSITEQQCSTCSITANPSVEAMQNAILRLYGPSAGGQVRSTDIYSYSFSDLARFVSNPAGMPEMATYLNLSNWVVVSILNYDPSRTESGALKQLLTNHYELIRNKKVLVFAFNAPYYLDSTDISKITAYYGLYSKGSAFIDYAVRLIFQESGTTGSSPVSIPGIGYDLITAMSPDPNQIISLSIDSPTTPQGTGTTTPEPMLSPVYQMGDTLPLRTGIILDHNQNPVPDGTIVRFLFTVGGDTGSTQQVETETINGIARASYRLQSPGIIVIKAVSDPAQTSSLLQITIAEGQAASITEIAPTLNATPTLKSTTAPEATPIQNTSESIVKPSAINFLAWVAALCYGAAGSFGLFFLIQRKRSERWGLRFGLLAGSAAMIGFSIMDLIIKPSNQYFWLWILLATTVGLLIGWGVGEIWYRSVNRKKDNTSTN
jgi:beta-N-acetylhexosaminidase